MNLKYKYHCDSGLLEAYRSYTLAQNNSLSDTIVITSTASDASKYNYCLEFTCYNSKSIPKAQYISPILTYGSEGITFVVPNNLTQFTGHVDMQLTGYDPEDSSIVFKSISKNCKAFDIEGSLGVLEKDLNETPNVLTEVMEQLAAIKNIRKEILDEAKADFSEHILEMVSQYRWFSVKFLDRGELIEERHYVQGSKIAEPQYTLPPGCILVDGWFNPATNSIWDFENDVIEDNMTLSLNYMSAGVVIVNGAVKNAGTSTSVYIPDYYGGQLVTRFDENVPIKSNSTVYMGNYVDDIENVIGISSSIKGIYFPSDNPYICNHNGAIYMKDEENELYLLFVPARDDGFYAVKEGCKIINTYSLTGRCNINKLVLPDSLRGLFQYSIIQTDIESLVFPRNFQSAPDYAVVGNEKLKKIYFEGDVPDEITDLSFFANIVGVGGVRPTLYVRPQYYANFKSRNLAYEIKVWGDDYFEEKYALKEA